MRSYRNQVSPCWLLIVAVIISASVAQSVTVGFNESAILPCGRKCSGLVRWTMADSPDVELAWCDQISCSSLEGFIISHEQYREGNFSLTIIAADYTTTGLYTCQCGGKDVCDVYLSIKRLDKEVNRTTPSRKGTQKIKWELPGIIITILFLFVVFFPCITWCCCHKKRSKHDQCPDDEKSDPAALTSLYTKTGKDKLSCDELCDLKA